MKRVVWLVVILLVCVGYVHSRERSQSIVFINGQKFYVHNVAEGETIYSLSKLYSVSSGEIINNNSELSSRKLQVDQSIKIPIKESAQSEIQNMDRKMRKKTFDTHKVAKGETLYSISRHHELSVATIVEDNPEIDPTKLSVGQEILIRKGEMGKSSQEETIEELTEYKDQMNRVAPEGYEYHLVMPKETLYSLLRNTQMSRKEFMEMNETASSELKAGSIVIVRATPSEEVEEEPQPQQELPVEIKFRSLSSRDTLNVAVLLPLSNESEVAQSIFKEFYQGFLYGVEELKQSGRSVNITLYDTRRDSELVANIVSEEAFQRSNLIVGPVYEELLDDVLKFAERRSIPVVSPLASLSEANSGVLFQMAPPAEHKYDKIGSMLADSVEVTLIYTSRTDSLYEAEVKELLGNKPYKIHNYRYEHPSVVAQRIAAAYKNNRQSSSSPSDLSSIIVGDKRVSTIFVMADNETDVDRILSALASAEIGLRSRSIKVGEFSVVSNSKWNRYVNIDRAILFRTHVTSFSSYHAKRDSGIIKRFDSRYIKSFGELPSLYSYRGYDVAKIFGEGLYSDIDYNMEGRTFTPLQTTYRFQRVRDKESRANQNWMRANYQDNFTITLE